MLIIELVHKKEGVDIRKNEEGAKRILHTGPIMVACQWKRSSPEGPALQLVGGSLPRSCNSCANDNHCIYVTIRRANNKNLLLLFFFQKLYIYIITNEALLKRKWRQKGKWSVIVSVQHWVNGDFNSFGYLCNTFKCHGEWTDKWCVCCLCFFLPCCAELAR